MDKTSLTLGWLAGRRIAGQRSKQKTIIGYSYNGTVLPALPEWDKKTYPYACILHYPAFSTSLFSLVLSACPIEVGAMDDGRFGYRYAVSGVSAQRYSWREGDGDAWAVFDTIVTNTGWYEAVTQIPIWASFDIVNIDDASIYLSASDPIPVYDTTMYSYNGVILPKLPEWDKETYPYAYISEMYTGRTDYPQSSSYVAPYVLTLLSEKPYWDSLSNAKRLKYSDSANVIRYEYRPYAFDGWVQTATTVVMALKYDDKDTYDMSLIWTNTDTDDFEGALLCAASDPIPVYA